MYRAYSVALRSVCAHFPSIFLCGIFTFLSLNVFWNNICLICFKIIFAAHRQISIYLRNLCEMTLFSWHLSESNMIQGHYWEIQYQDRASDAIKQNVEIESWLMPGFTSAVRSPIPLDLDCDKFLSDIRHFALPFLVMCNINSKKDATI